MACDHPSVVAESDVHGVIILLFMIEMTELDKLENISANVLFTQSIGCLEVCF
jgi:hypothetical protein